MTYSMVSVAMIPLARKLTGIFEIRALSVASALLVIAGSALAGAAPNISSVIVGRAIMGVGSVILYQV
jgi:predicted MFS family arabinose efflux permease